MMRRAKSSKALWAAGLFRTIPDGFVPSFFELSGEAVFRDEVVRGDYGFVDILFGTGWERVSVRDGFDFYDFFDFDHVFTEFDFCAQEFQGSLHSGGEVGDWFGEDIYDPEARGLVEEIFHLEETELLVDELMDEGDRVGHWRGWRPERLQTLFSWVVCCRTNRRWTTARPG